MRAGFVVNPIAGMGGKVALKGTDNVVNQAISKGAKPVAPERAIEFLTALKTKQVEKGITLITCPGTMGRDEAKKAGFESELLPMEIEERTTAEDTKQAVKLMLKAKADIIVFVGGDGTAKDIFDAIDGRDSPPILGVPSGVKMYSGIFAISPSDAADVVQGILDGETQIEPREILDADESGIRTDVFALKIHGMLNAPFLPAHVQGGKQISPETLDEKENQEAIAKFIVEQMKDCATYILGPGTTIKCIADLLGIQKTLLGVDICRNGSVLLDVDERTILNELTNWKLAWIILSPIGRQGILLGRGNQQISPEIINKVGRDHIIVAATRSKLQSMEGNVLRVDTGDAATDSMLRGYIRVATDYREWRLVLVK